MPVEPADGRGRLPRPQHPGGEDAVEEGLHQRRAEEGCAALPLELHAQRLLQGDPHGVEGGSVAGSLDPGQAVSGVGGQQLCQVPWLSQGRPVGEGAAEVLPQGCANLPGEGAGMLQLRLKLREGTGQPEGLQLGGPALGVLAQQHEVAGVGHQDQAVTLPVAADLVAVGGEPGIVAGGLDLHHAALRRLALLGLAPLNLAGGVEAEVRVAGPLLGQLTDAEDLGLQRSAHRVEQVGQRRVVGQLVRAAPGGADAAQVLEIGFHNRYEVGGAAWHIPPGVPGAPSSGDGRPG